MARKRTVVQVLAKRVRELRELQGLNQADLARASGLAPSQILMLERGQQAARIVTIAAVAEALGITLSELFMTGATVKPGPDRADRLADRVRGLGDGAIEALERVVEAMVQLARGGGHRG